MAYRALRAFRFLSVLLFVIILCAGVGLAGATVPDQHAKTVADVAKAKEICGILEKPAPLDKDFAECVNRVFVTLQGEKK